MKFAKILSILFALILTLSLCTVSVFADEKLSDADAAAEAIAAAETDKADEAADETDEADEAAESEKTAGERLTFLESLGYMGVGMLCIIIVMGVLIGVTVLLNKVTAPKEK